MKENCSTYDEADNFELRKQTIRNIRRAHYDENVKKRRSGLTSIVNYSACPAQELKPYESGEGRSFKALNGAMEIVHNGAENVKPCEEDSYLNEMYNMSRVYAREGEKKERRRKRRKSLHRTWRDEVKQNSSKIVEFLTFVSIEHTNLFQLVLLLPLLLMTLFIVFVEQGQLTRPVIKDM